VRSMLLFGADFIYGVEGLHQNLSWRSHAYMWLPLSWSILPTAPPVTHHNQLVPWRNCGSPNHILTVRQSSSIEPSGQCQDLFNSKKQAFTKSDLGRGAGKCLSFAATKKAEVRGSQSMTDWRKTQDPIWKTN
jgi:hypothetical protein